PAEGQAIAATQESKFDNNFDSWELTVGDYIKFNKRFMARVGFGIAYVSIRESSEDIFGAEVLPGAEVESKFNNKFWGIGPKLTFDSQFDLIRHLSIVSGIGGSLLIGESEFNFNPTFAGAALNATASEAEETQVAFGVDGRLGLRWAQPLNRDLSWDIEAGYQATTYINSLASGNPGINASSVGGLTQADFQFSENYWNYGPYVGIGIDFM
ncbi:MAG: Lpg1974 family pore-forming outer membrane protein, partial [Legionellales bacterium]